MDSPRALGRYLAFSRGLSAAAADEHADEASEYRFRAGSPPRPRGAHPLDNGAVSRGARSRPSGRRALHRGADAGAGRPGGAGGGYRDGGARSKWTHPGGRRGLRPSTVAATPSSGTLPWGVRCECCALLWQDGLRFRARTACGVHATRYVGVLADRTARHGPQERGHAGRLAHRCTRAHVSSTDRQPSRGHA